jgi:hypothetical protein
MVEVPNRKRRWFQFSMRIRRELAAVLYDLNRRTP